MSTAEVTTSPPVYKFTRSNVSKNWTDLSQRGSYRQPAANSGPEAPCWVDLSLSASVFIIRAALQTEWVITETGVQRRGKKSQTTGFLQRHTVHRIRFQSQGSLCCWPTAAAMYSVRFSSMIYDQPVERRSDFTRQFS